MRYQDEDGFGPDDVATALSVSRETLGKLEKSVDILDDWRQRINIIGPKERDRIWRRHIFDSLQLLPQITPGARILDLGSGGGYPGIPLACASSEGVSHVTMVESVGKKTTYLTDCVSRLGLPARVLNGRVEAQEGLGDFDYVTARAFAPLPKLLDYSYKWLKNGAVGLFHKGEQWKEEIADAESAWSFSVAMTPSISRDGGVILTISEVERASKGASHSGRSQPKGRRR